MLRLTCHQPCREILPHPHSHTPNYINLHTRLVLCPQSTSSEVTKQVAANKALRGQLQEEEDKLRQLQEKSVSHTSPFFFFKLVGSVFTFFIFLFLFWSSALNFSFFHSASLLVFVSPRPCISLSLSEHFSSVVLESTMWRHPVCSTSLKPLSPLQ